MYATFGDVCISGDRHQCSAVLHDGQTFRRGARLHRQDSVDAIGHPLQDLLAPMGVAVVNYLVRAERKHVVVIGFRRGCGNVPSALACKLDGDRADRPRATSNEERPVNGR